jgi:hypothetical protein
MFRDVRRMAMMGCSTTSVFWISITNSERSVEDKKSTHHHFTKLGGIISAVNSQEEILRQVSKDCREKHKFEMYDTPAHRVLLTSVHKKCELLAKNRFVDKNGVQCRMIQGPKGVGKSTILEKYVELCTNYHPKVIPIYLSFDSLNNKFHDANLEERTVGEFIHNKLTSEFGLEIVLSPNKKEYLGESIARALTEADKYVLLIVDEFEEVYRTSDTNVNRNNRLHILGDLNWLGNQKTGRFAIFLCGSSSSCPLLVTCHASKDEFPLLSDAPHLNGSKYRTLRLPVSPFTDFNVISAVVKDYYKVSDEDWNSVGAKFDMHELLKLIAFGVGAVPRSVDSLCTDLDENESEIFSGLGPNAHLSGARWYHSTSAPLHRRLIERMRSKNSSVEKMITRNDSLDVDLDLVMTTPWETEFNPLTYDDIFMVWDRLCEEDEIFSKYRCDVEKLQHSLLELCDKGQITYTDVQQGMPVGLFPICPAQVFVGSQPTSLIHKFSNTYDIQLREAFRVLFMKIGDEIIKKSVSNDKK